MANLRRLALFIGALLPAVLAAPTEFAKRQAAPNKWIVTLKSDATDSKINSHLEWVDDVHRRSLSKRDTVGVKETYNISSWNAYAGEFDDETLAKIKASLEVCTRDGSP